MTRTEYNEMKQCGVDVAAPVKQTAPTSASSPTPAAS
jgi:hypothetical protein